MLMYSFYLDHLGAVHCYISSPFNICYKWRFFAFGRLQWYSYFFILKFFYPENLWCFFLLFSSQLPNWLKIALSYRWSVNSILTETICLYLIFKTNLKLSSYALKGPLNIFCPIYPLNKLEHGHPNFNVYRDRRRCSWMSPYITILFFP